MPRHRHRRVTAPPRIGISVGHESRGARRLDATPHDYVAAILNAGGLPLLIPPVPAEIASRAVETIDGLLLTGGGDVSPTCYNANYEHETADVDDERDHSELALLDAALARKIPVFGICRGAQLVNVAFGGTLRQHLPKSAPVRHTQPRRRYETVHRVSLEPGSILARLTGAKELDVNSIHHQGIDRLGQDLIAAGRSDDGLVEVIENQDRQVLAVQWHPECLPHDRPSVRLFSWLIEQAISPRSPAN